MTGVTRRNATRLLFGSLAGAALFSAKGAVSADEAKKPVPAVPTRGFNLPGWVDRPDGKAPAADVLGKLHRLGFSSVRLPVDADPIDGDAHGRHTTLGRIADAIAMLNDAGFTVIVDMHPSGKLIDAFAARPKEAERHAAAAWRHLAPVIAASPANAVYAELLNEPPMEQAAWHALRERLAETVRAACPHHPIVWGPARYQGLWELAGSKPLADRNSIAAVHYYSPIVFTHQCEDWDDSPLRRMRGLPFPATRTKPAVTRLAQEFRDAGDEEALTLLDNQFSENWTPANIMKQFGEAGRWSKRHDCPVILDEFGVLDFCADPVSRQAWTRAVRTAAEANDIGWAYWELDQGFGFIESRTDTQGFEHGMINALMDD